MAKQSKKMTDVELASLLDGQISDAVSFDSERSTKRDQALEYRDGKMTDTPEQKGKSSVVSRDVQDTISWVKPGLMRVFLASDRVADYQPRKPHQIQQAKDATELVNFVFLEEVGGYKILADAIDDALTLGNGIIKHWWDETPCYEVSTHTGLTEDEFTQLVADDDVEVLEHTARQADEHTPDPAAAGAVAGGEPAAATGMGEAPPAGAPAPDAAGGSLGGVLGVGPVPATLHDVKIKHKKDEGHLRVQAMPPENFLIARNAIVLDETVDLVGHWDTPTRSDLIKRWPDKKEEINALPAWSEGMDSATKSSRDADLRALLSNATTTDKSMERVKIYEVYPLVDYDGDGIAERRYIVTGDRGRTDKEGRVLLENVEWPDDLPFTDLVADPVPHQWVGRSIFDEMSDIQRIKTVLTRQTLDNLYLANQPQRAAQLSQVENPDELINPTIGGVVLTTGEPAGVIMDLAVPFVAQHSYAALEYFDSVGTRRVGNITMGLDPETLQNQTATSVQAQQSAGQSKVELFARNIAETGLKRLFKCLLKLLITHQTEPKFMRRKGEPVAMEPSGWDSDMDVSINVGLGAGTRDHDMMLLQQIAMKQELIFQSMGPDNPLVSLMEYRNTLAKMVEVGGVRSPELYFKEVDPQTLQAFVQQMQNKPDPKMLELQMKAQMDAQKIQMDAQFKDREMSQKAQIEQVQAQADIATQQTKMQSELALAERKAQLEERKMMLEMEMRQKEHEADLHFKHAEHQQNLALREREMQMGAQEHEMGLHYGAKKNEQSLEHAEQAQKLKAKATPAKGADK